MPTKDYKVKSEQEEDSKEDYLMDCLLNCNDFSDYNPEPTYKGQLMQTKYEKGYN